MNKGLSKAFHVSNPLCPNQPGRELYDRSRLANTPHTICVSAPKKSRCEFEAPQAAVRDSCKWCAVPYATRRVEGNRCYEKDLEATGPFSS